MQAAVDGQPIGYDRFGAGERILVLLHAFPLNRQQWRPQGEALGREAGLQVIAPDLRGSGESSLETGLVTVEQMAADVLKLLDALDVRVFLLGGLSMGGYVAFACLRQAPQRVQGLLLADTRATGDSPEARASREATALYVEQHGGGALLERDAPRLFGHTTRTKRPEIVEQARQIAAQNSSIGLAATARGLGLRPDSTALLAHIACPTLVLVGDEDVITPLSDAQVLAERIPHAQLEVIHEAGHLANLEQPDLFTEAVARFLRQHAYVR